MSGKRHIEWHGQRSAAENARRELPGLVSSYFAYVRKELAQDPAPADLHRLRLATKRLRYTLELFGPCYGRGLEARLDTLRKIQQKLGEVNDCVATREMLKKAMRHAPQRARVDQFLHEKAEAEAKSFCRKWKELFEAPGREEWWTAYLKRFARR